MDAGETVNLSAEEMEKPLAFPFYLCRCGMPKNKPLCDGSHLAARHSGVKIASACFQTMFEKTELGLDTVEFDLLVNAMAAPVTVMRWG